jgi:hypothetical protein
MTYISVNNEQFMRVIHHLLKYRPLVSCTCWRNPINCRCAVHLLEHNSVSKTMYGRTFCPIYRNKRNNKAWQFWRRVWADTTSYVLLIRNEKHLNTIVLFLYYFTLMLTDFRLYFPIDICVTLALWGMNFFQVTCRNSISTSQGTLPEENIYLTMSSVAKAM